MSRRSYLLPALAAVLLGAAGAPALAADRDNCFDLRNWEGWKAPTPNVILLRVGVSQLYRLDLSGPVNQLQEADVHLINYNPPSTWVCQPSDLDLKVADNTGVVFTPLFVASIRRLTPGEAAQIPPRDRP